MKRALSTVALGAAVALLSPIGCRRDSAPRGTATANTTPKRGGVLRVATFSDLRSLDPAVSMDTESQPYINLLFAGLVDYDEQGKVVPDLAERFEESADGLTYRFFLRRGVRMHDGSELTADDIKRSVERSFAPLTPCPALAFYERLLGLADYHSGKTPSLAGVVVESPYVVVFKLSAPDATFLPVMALPFVRPVCKSGGTQYQDSFQNNPCGAGAFRFDSWQPGRYLRLRRFEEHYAPAYLDAIELRMDVSRLTQRFQMQRGELDAILNEFERPGAIYFRTHPEWSKYFRQSPVPEVYGDFLNVEMKPFTDRRVRQAVAAALNRPALQQYYEGWTVVTGHMIPPGIAGHNLHEPYEQTYDLARARRLMAEAGYPFDPATGKGGYPETIVYHAGEGEAAVRYSQLLQHDLAQIGIRIEIKEGSFAQYLAVAGRPKTAAMGYVGWQIDFADPSDFFEPILSSRAIAEEDSQNKAFYSNPTLDKLLDDAHVELDPKKRIEMYRRADQIVCDDAPWSFAYYPLRLQLLQPWVRDFKQHPIWHRPFKPVWIDEAALRSAHALLGPFRSTAALGALLR